MRVVPLKRPSKLPLLAALAVIAIMPRLHWPVTYTGKVMCNGMLVEKAQVGLTGEVTVTLGNGAVIRIHDGGSCASLLAEPHGLGMGPEIEP